MTAPTFNEIREAAARIQPFISRTPVLTNEGLDKLAGASLFFKCENLQQAGSFKLRGATNTILRLMEAGPVSCVTTHSSGNHGAAVALAALRQGLRAIIVMPRTAPAVKQANVARYGAEIVLCEPNVAAREMAATRVMEEFGATLVHPYDDVRVIAGQGTAASELIEVVGEIEAFVAPVGGGGLLSGTALSAAALVPNARVYGAEPEGADDAFRSLRAGRIIPMVAPDTIADGLLTSLGELTFPILRDHVHEILTVGEGQIVAAMRLIWERLKVIVEPSGAVPLAAVLAYPDRFANRRVGLILSGGNVDLERLPF